MKMFASKFFVGLLLIVSTALRAGGGLGIGIIICAVVFMTPPSMVNDSVKSLHSPTFTDVLFPAACVATSAYLEYAALAFTANFLMSVTLDGVVALQFLISDHEIPFQFA